MQDVIARFKTQHSDFAELPNKAVFQMNDTHPTIAVAELMRLLIDQEGLDWDKAWGITTKVRPWGSNQLMPFIHSREKLTKPPEFLQTADAAFSGITTKSAWW